MQKFENFLKGVADAIREKTGKSELIAPVNFAEEIKSISAGGGGAEGGDEWQYYDVRNTTLPESQWLVMMSIFPTLVALIDYDNGPLGIIGGAGILAMYGVD